MRLNSQLLVSLPSQCTILNIYYQAIKWAAMPNLNLLQIVIILTICWISGRWHTNYRLTPRDRSVQWQSVKLNPEKNCQMQLKYPLEQYMFAEKEGFCKELQNRPHTSRFVFEPFVCLASLPRTCVPADKSSACEKTALRILCPGEDVLLKTQRRPVEWTGIRHRNWVHFDEINPEYNVTSVDVTAIVIPLGNHGEEIVVLSKCLLQHDYAAFNLDFHLDFIPFSLLMMVIIDYWIVIEDNVSSPCCDFWFVWRNGRLCTGIPFSLLISLPFLGENLRAFFSSIISDSTKS